MTETVSEGVLVVEDDSDIREIIVKLLQDRGYRVTAVKEGSEALRWLRKEERKPCLILLDLMMPVMDGPSFRLEQRRDPTLAHIPIVVLSAYADLHETIADMAASAVFMKPIDLTALLRVVDEHCSARATA